MRLFAAIELPDPVREHLATAVAEAGLPDRRLRLTTVEQWHLTTAFYGEVSEPQSEELAERLERAAGRTPAMTLSVAGAGTFPANAAVARVLWCGVAGDLEILSRLADRCSAAGRRCGLQMEGGRYRPHLTLGRARNGTADLNTLAGALASYQGVEWRATSLALIRSTLGAEVRHELASSFPLA
jgi:2'-5' RNA ligase